MRVLALTKHGGIDDLAILDLPAPTVTAPDDVLVRIRAAAINRLDLFLLPGLKGLTLGFPHIVGTDGAGVVEAVGRSVTSVKPGDRVLLNPGISCGDCPACRRDDEPLCREFRILGEHRAGTVAEQIVVPERNVGKLTADMPWTTAAAFPLATLTAWRMLTTRARVLEGEAVLIWGAGGGVSLAALRIANHLGAKVFITGSSEDKVRKALELGADTGFNHAERTPDDIVRDIRKRTGGGIDVVVDSVGERTWEASLKALRPGGRLVTCGATTGPHVSLDIRRLFWFQWSLLGSTMGSRKEFAEIVALANKGKLWPVVDSVVPLEAGARAFQRMDRGDHLGKLVIEVS